MEVDKNIEATGAELRKGEKDRKCIGETKRLTMHASSSFSNLPSSSRNIS